MADQRIQRRCNKKKLLVLSMMLLGDDEYKHVERRCWSRQWVSRREERGAYYTCSVAILNGFLRDHGKLIDAPSLVDLNFVAATCRTFGHTMRFDATRLLALILSQRSVARIQTSLNSCDRSQRQKSVAATMIFTCHTMRSVTATCRGDVSQRFVASCVSAFRAMNTR